MASPIINGKVSTPYNRKCCRTEGGKKTPHYWTEHRHKGVDYAVPVGTPVHAMVDGTVVNANWGKSYGTQIVAQVQGGFVIYAHLSKSLVKPGDKITKGQLIGKSGKSGNISGPHLHVEYRDNIRWSTGKDLDPKGILAA
jgi:murein DD-endopeptidase MepM/ murein hydrolase activator NlpD